MIDPTDLRPLTVLPEHLGFLLPFEIADADRRMLVEAAVSHGWFTGFGGANPALEGKYVHVLQVRTTRDPRVTPFADFWWRYDPDVAWTWLDTPATAVVQRVLEPLAQVMPHVTKVSLLVVAPHKTLPMHADVVAGSTYDSIAGVPNATSNSYQPQRRLHSPDNDWHRHHRYLAIKIPLYEDGASGAIDVQIGQDAYRIDCGPRYYAMNEVDMLHGTLPSPHYRGVVFVHGWMDMAALDALPHAPLPVTHLGRVA